MAARTLVISMAAAILAVVYVGDSLGIYPVETLINFALYGFLLLLSILALQRERFFRGIFCQMSFLFGGISLIVALRIFSALLPTGLQSDIYVYSTMLLPLLFAWTVVYVLYAYIFSDWSRLHRMLLTLLTILPVWLIAFFPYYLDPRALALAPQASNPSHYYHPLYDRAIYVYLLSLSAITTFFMIKLRSDRTIGVYVDTLMFWFSLLIIFEILYNFSRVTSSSIFSISQYAATGTLIMMAGTLILRLRFLSQAAGMLYESQIVSPEPFVGRRAGFFDRFIRGNFFDSEAIAKRLYLENPKGRIQPKFATGKAAGVGALHRSLHSAQEQRETRRIVDDKFS
ncbi:MAG: hypothetical protein V1784_03295 [bacterium]